MSSNEEEYIDGDTSSGLEKKRRIQRACDMCRRKKIRCNSVQIPGNPCSNCISSRFSCTYVEAAKKRSPPKGYVENLENRVNKLDKLERLLRRLCPDEAVYNQINASLDSNGTIVGEPPVDPSALVGDIASKARPNAPTPETVTSAIRGAMEGKFDTSRTGDNDPTLLLADNLKRMVLTPNDQFFGKSSGAMLIRTAVELKNEYAGGEGPVKPAVKTKRTEFWDIKPWEMGEATASPEYNFPDLDLALHCIDLYFLHSNLYLPLLHRPTFDKSVKEGLYLTNDNFAPVFLLVCAVGARHSDNPQVRLDGIDSHHSAGWKWFKQVEIMKQSLRLAPPTLYDLQLYCLCILYLHGSSAPQSCWTLAGIGIRLAQHVGVHRRKGHGHTLTIDDELWKRAFWVLVCNDRIFSFSLGRACAIQDEDFDLDLPVDCDDEYWDHPDPEKCFKQPCNRPSSYSINESKILLGFVGRHWEQHIVAELDSALNKWVDSVPDHLRWDPNREDDTFFNQSVLLYATYYHIQIIVHRPFIPSPNKPSPLAFPSLAICTNAARSCSHVVDIHRKKNRKPLPLIQMPVFTSGIVLLLSIWGGKCSGLFMDPDKEMVDVHKCMKALKASEGQLPTAGRLWDVLYELACVGELPLPQPSPPSGTKRDRESDSPLSTSPSTLPSTLVSQNQTPRVITGSRRVRKEPSFINQTQQIQTPHPQYQPSQAAPPPSDIPQCHIPPPPSQRAPSRSRSHSQIRPDDSQQTTSTISPFNNTDLNVFALPVYSNELGRLPLHRQMTFTAQAHLSQPQLPQLDPETSYWYTASQPTSHVDANGASSSYDPRYPAPAPQQQPHPYYHRTPQGIPGGEFPSASEASSVAQGRYGIDTATGMLFDAMGERTGYTQQRTSTYGLGPMPSSFPSMGSGSIVSTPPQSSSGSSMENIYRRLEMEAMPNRPGGHYQHQHQTIPLQQERQPSSYPFVGVWSNAPTGFGQSDGSSTFLSNFGALMQGNVQDHSGGQPLRQHQHQRVPQQHEEQPLSYPFTIGSDMRSNDATEFELDNGATLMNVSELAPGNIYHPTLE